MSDADLILRVDKTKDNKHGIAHVASIPSDEACVLYLGGNGTDDLRAASGNAKIIEKEILPNLPVHVPVYAVKYDFDNDDLEFARDANFSKYGYNFLSSPRAMDFVSVNDKNINLIFHRNVLPRVITETGRARKFDLAKANIEKLYVAFDGNLDEMRGKLNQMLRTEMLKAGFSSSQAIMFAKTIVRNSTASKDLDFEYISDIFNKAILPRISDNGRRLPLNVAMARMRKMNIIAHCHGAYVAQKLEEKMAETMRKLGYDAREIRAVQSQTLVVAHAPVIPLGKSKFRVISFTSARDYISARPKNWVTKYVRNKQYQENRKIIGDDWLPSCFLAGKNGDVFVVHNAFLPRTNGRPSEYEHQNAHYLPTEKQTEIGKFMNTVAGNILTNGIKNSLNKKFVPLPPTRELVLGDSSRDDMRKTFDKLVKNGRAFMDDVYKFATAQVHELQMQKLRAVENAKKSKHNSRQ